MRQYFFMATVALVASMAACTAPNEKAAQGEPQPGIEYDKIALKADNGRYVCADLDLPGDDVAKLTASREQVGDWETFTVRNLGGGRVALKAGNGKYVCADFANGNYLAANRDSVAEWETFEIVELANGKVAIRAAGNNYVRCRFEGDAPLPGLLVADRTEVGAWETFTLEIK